MNGFLLINKPQGPTSHDIINQLRKITGIKRIGHAGTLDPFADGLLIVGIGQSTKLLKYFVGLDKKYRATLHLGATSDTYDKTGVVVPSLNIEQGEVWETSSYRPLTPSYLRRGYTPSPSLLEEGQREVLSRFLGPQLQTPPMYSAKKINGKKLYELARQGKEIERKPHEIEIYSIKIISYAWPYLTLDIHCSSGTYIRTLGHDIGQALGCGAYVESLTRTAIGDFALEHAVVVPPLLTPDTWHRYLILSPDVQSTVMVFGVFDLLHKGHEYFFTQAKKFGSKLIIVITTDNNVIKQKKKPPTYTQQERLQRIKALKYVDDAYIGDETDYFVLIQQYSPDLICLGYDQTYSETQLRQELKERGLSTHVLRLDAYKPDLYKSSILKKKPSLSTSSACTERTLSIQ